MELFSGRAVDAYFALIGLSYLFAFWSLYQQWPGLYSQNGLLPADIFAEGHAKADIVLGLLSQLPIDCFAEYALLCGCCLSATVLAGYHSKVVLAVLWLLYLLLFSVGQTFLSFQWDTLLLETGFVTILAAPYWLLPPLAFDEKYTKIGAPYIWCIRFLAFKLMFLSGVVKLQANCPTWRDLTALSYHFQTQCLPTPISWYFSQLPPVVLHIFVAATLVIEIPLALLLVIPIDYARRIAAIINIVLQIAIMITGNYNFFNILTVALMVACYESDSMTMQLSASRGSRALQGLMVTAVVAASCALMLDVPSLTDRDSPWWSGKHLSLREDLYNKHLQSLLFPAVASCLCIVLLCTTLSTVHAIASQRQQRALTLGSAAKPLHCAVALVWILVCSTAFHPIVDVRRLLPRVVLEVAGTHLSRWHLASSYGLFRSMTGVGQATPAMQARGLTRVARPEVVVEVLVSAQDHKQQQAWVELPFRDKLTAETSWPRFLVPLLEHPRLDWQMWFLALGDYTSNPWFINLCYKLLQPPGGKLFSAEVVSLLDTSALDRMALLQNSSRAIRSVRAKLYAYDVTYWPTPWSVLKDGVVIERTLVPQKFWHRDFVRDFLPEISLDNESLKAFLESHKLKPLRRYSSAQARY